jgi:peptidoglycan L-alanyl-D-glutamate endopeptidase CwlK
MFKFGKTSTTRLDTCHADIRHVMIVALYISKVDFFIAEGSRNENRQDRYFATGASKLKYPHSFHNTKPVSLAVDGVPWVNGKAVWVCETLEDKAAWRELTKAIKQAAKMLGVPLEWGFDLWKWDRPHWQLTSYRD